MGEVVLVWGSTSLLSEERRLRRPSASLAGARPGLPGGWPGGSQLLLPPDGPHLLGGPGPPAGALRFPWQAVTQADLSGYL